MGPLQNRGVSNTNSRSTAAKLIRCRGYGSHLLSHGRKFALPFAIVASTATWMAAPHLAQAQFNDACVPHANGVEVCSGNQIAGISKALPVTTLVVNSLSPNSIRPASGTPGVRLSRQRPRELGEFFTTPPSLNLEVVPIVNINTLGASAHGIHVESLGGAGFDGDSSVFNTNGDPGTPGFAGGAVAVNTCMVDGQGRCVAGAGNQSQIDTLGDRAYGIFAQSRGGNGGNGESIGPTLVGNGGNGGAAGDGGLVTVDNTANISTEGDLAYGIFAQSVGGTGGKGGSVDPSVSAAFGEGGIGGRGGDVIVTNAGHIKTRDFFTNPLMIPVFETLFIAPLGFFRTSLVTVEVLGPDGDGSHGIYARSRGGSAGDAGSATGIFSGGSLANLIAKLQGRAADSSAGEVTINNSGAITASGNQSRAIFAESIGGAGGDGGTAAGLFALGGGGSAAGHGGNVKVENSGKLKTDGDNASAILAESIGGGGGNGGGAVGIGLGFSLAVGGGADDGGDGGAVTVISRPDADPNVDDIETSGDFSNGIDARSIGGGGGTGGYATSLTVGVPIKGVSVGASVAIGGSGEVGGDAGVVKVDTTSTITTQGKNSHGVFAESTGGGGGSGGRSVAITASGGGSTLNLGAAVSVGGTGGGGGNSAPVRGLPFIIPGLPPIVIVPRLLDGSGNPLESVTVLSSGDITTGNAGKNDVTVDQLAGVDSAHIAALQAFANSDPDGDGVVTPLTIAEVDSLTSEQLLAIAGFDAAAAAEIAKAARLFMKQDEKSHGIYARGIGGGGGDGGLSVAGTLTFGKAVGVAVAVGGSGAGGGNGGTVKIINDGHILTHGEKSHAILAQSLGGGGGDGGGSVTGTLAFGGSENTASVGVSVGGSGGGGGVGENVFVANNGSLTTNSAGSFGVLATSVGGGGGNGGFSVAGSLSASSGKSVTLDVSVGGDGGVGNTGGAVEVLNTGLIETFADNSDAIRAQSVGGKGGNGGMSVAAAGAFGGDNLNMTVSVGGSGGVGSTGGKVAVTNQKNIDTHGDLSAGVFAQSIGGGGGTGGSSIAAAATFYEGLSKNAKNVNLDFSVGGSGGDGNEGGAVTVGNDGEIHTIGHIAPGIYAQSIGGGGGQGGAARSFSLITNKCKFKNLPNLPRNTLAKANPILNIVNRSIKKSDDNCPSDTAGSFNLAVGGAGGDSADGGVVTVTNTQDIVTEGLVFSHGIFAQSIGGGGGTGGEGADGVGFPLIGIDTPSIENNVSLTVGGSGGASGDGGAVLVDHRSGNITTAGMASFGVYAQSVGGGGGQGGHGVSGLIGISIGGEGGSAGDGGPVTVNLGSVSTPSTIDTAGFFAHGVFAQSVGGGGGLGGNIARGADLFDSIPNIGGITLQGGNAGSGGEVIVKSFGNITTGALASLGFGGLASTGIFAQSVGGGGGLAGGGLDNAFVLSGSAGGHGAGGKVTVNHTGNITTDGDFSPGIYAQSEGGTKSFNDVVNILNAVFPIDDPATSIANILARQIKTLNLESYRTPLVGGDVTVTVDGDVTANGAGSAGIYAQSKGADGNGNIKVTVNGKVQGGTGLSMGVGIEDGQNNVLTIRQSSTVTTLNGVSGSAIIGTLGNETINNSGTVTGNVDLGAGINAFNNFAGSRLNAGAIVNVGAGNTLISRGTLSPGGADNVLTSNVTGDLVQTSEGTLLVDLDFASGNADRVTVVNGKANLAGKAVVNTLNRDAFTPGAREVTIASATGGVISPNLDLVFEKSATINYLLDSDPTEVRLHYEVDASPAGVNLTPHQSATGEHVNAIQRAGGSASFAPIAAALFAQPDGESLGAAYDRLSPEVFVGTSTKTSFSNLQFSNAMLSCRERGGGYRFIREGQCGWMEMSRRFLDQDRTATNFGFEEDAVEVAGGVQNQISEHYHLGFGLSYESSSLDVDDNLSQTEGEQVQGGAILKGRYGATTFSGAVSGGYGWYDTTRFVSLPGPGVFATSDQEIRFVSGHLRVAHIFEQGDWYVRPLFDAGVTGVHLGSFRETGAGGANLNVDSHDETYVTLQPAVEIGGEFNLQRSCNVSCTLVRPYTKVGLTHFVSGTTPEITATLEGAPVGVAPFKVTGDTDETFLDISVGMDVLWAEGVNIRLGYEGRFSDRTEQHGAGLKVSVMF